MDIKALTEYNGQGRCKEVRLYGFVATKYKEDMRTWACKRNWRVWLEEKKRNQYNKIVRSGYIKCMK